MMLTTLKLNQEGNVEKLKFSQNSNSNSLSGLQLAGFFGGFSLWFCQGSIRRFVWYLENANIKTAGKNKVLKDRKTRLLNDVF